MGQFCTLPNPCTVPRNLKPYVKNRLIRFVWCIKKIIDSRSSSNRFESWINYSIRIDTSFWENRYYHDSARRRIDTIMIRLGGESILSWFGWVENRYYHDSKNKKSRKSIFLKKIDDEPYLLVVSYCTFDSVCAITQFCIVRSRR